MDEEEANKLFRHSDQAWLSHDSDPFLQKAIARVMNLGLLPPEVRRNSEAVQVVKYGGFGHYESHHDSEPDGMVFLAWASRVVPSPSFPLRYAAATRTSHGVFSSHKNTNKTPTKAAC